MSSIETDRQQLNEHVSNVSIKPARPLVGRHSNGRPSCLSTDSQRSRRCDWEIALKMFHWLVAVTFLYLVRAETIPEIDPRGFCSARSTDLYPHPHDCTQFIACSHGDGYFQSCPEDMIFSPDSKVCVYSANQGCSEPGRLDGYSGPYSVDITGYGLLFDKKPRLYGEDRHESRRRPGDMIHSVHTDVPLAQVRRTHSTDLPSYPTRTLGYAEDRKVDNVEDYANDIRCTKDGLYAHPTKCTLYINCAFGHAYITPCAAGTYFNPQTLTCGYDQSLCIEYDQTSFRPSLQSHTQARLPEHGSRQRPDQNSGSVIHSVMSNMDEMKATITSKVKQMYKREARIARQIDLGAHFLKEFDKAPFPSSVGRAFSGVQAFLGSTPYIKQLSVPAFFQLEALRMIKEKYSIEAAEFKLIVTELPSFLKPSLITVGPDMPNPRPRMDTCPYPRNDENNKCNPNDKYRTFDGSCNNLKRPLWGKSMRPLERFLSPDYADGIGAPRVGENGQPLPSARAVSLALFEDRDTPSHVHTLIHMTYGQFLDHDFSRAAVSKLSKSGHGIKSEEEMVDVKCGESECETRGYENRACFPIEIPYDDPVFSHTNKSCLMFVRTQEVPRDNCEPGPREQINQLTSHLDASMVYGSTREQAEKLRDKSNPEKLLTMPHPFDPHFKPLQPPKEVKDCRETNATIQCFTAGDGRLNEHVGLASIHTIFTRAHNNFVDKLKAINPHWSGERLFQEARRIIAAALQFITYNEYLPLVFGPASMDKYGLTLLKDGYYEGYDTTVSTDITNSFTTAAFRFGHSQIDNLIRFANQNFKLYTNVEISTVLRRPAKVYDTSLPGGSGIDSIILGHISQPAQITDRFFAKEITTRLFSENPPHQPGTDLPAINIQRGRDHGLPGYNAWRSWCGLSTARDFDDLVDIPSREVRRKFRQLYNTVYDIDLYAGAIAERPLPGGMVGPTFGCILGRQFRKTKVGDRFWHERRDPVIGFTYAQLKEIRKFTLARIICDNLDNVHLIQKFVMLQPISEAFRLLGRHNFAEVYSLASLYRGDQNERRPCSEIPDPDFRAWAERSFYF